ncbi:NAD(P)-binding domain-containing protein [Flavobacterium sp.]|uniref:NAD(P)-binding domain-containing protein n=1 Tax=Flavobacterium sp. TaxID=239 RepID=UPI0031E3768B
MTIGFIGFGALSSELARRFVHSGHTVLINNPPGNNIIQNSVFTFGSSAKLVSIQEAATAEIILLFTPMENLKKLTDCFPNMTGKIIIHTGNIVFNPDQPWSRRTGSISRGIIKELLPLSRFTQLFVPIALTSNTPLIKDRIFYHCSCNTTREQIRVLLAEINYTAIEILV